MPSDSNGVYSLPAGYLAVTGETILASQHNPPLEDLESAQTARLMRSGVAPMTGVFKVVDGAVGAPAVALASAPTWGLYKTSTGWGLAVSGANVLEANPTALVLPAGLTVAKTATLKDGGDIASANALSLGDGNIFNITGTTAITSIGTKGIGTLVWLRFNGILTLTHHATDLILTTGGNIVTAAGDFAIFEEYASGDWRMMFYQRASGDPVRQIAQMPAAFKKLSIKVASNTTVTVAADFITTTDGTSFQTTALSGTINLGSNGAANALDTGTIAANTWYAIWAIAKADGTTAGLASLSDTAPTMPSGYTFKARIGYVRTINASATLYGTWQLGRRAQYVVNLAQTTALPIIASGSSGSVTVPTWTSFTVRASGSTGSGILHIPKSASTIRLFAWTQNATGSVISAPNGSYGAYNSATNPPPIYANNPNCFAEFLLESDAVYYAGSASGIGISCLGWDDNI